MTSGEPRTAAGRELVEDEPRLVTGEHSMLARVLAIEAEASRIDVERWYAAFEKVTGFEAKTAEGKHAIYDQFAKAYEAEP
jgi:hypothetical protein